MTQPHDDQHFQKRKHPRMHCPQIPHLQTNALSLTRDYVYEEMQYTNSRCLYSLCSNCLLRSDYKVCGLRSHWNFDYLASPNSFPRRSQFRPVAVEPIHDLKDHISNLLKELPKHLADEETSTKEKLRASDYHLFCIVLALHLWSTLPQHHRAGKFG